MIGLTATAIYFCKGGWTGFVDLPVGQNYIAFGWIGGSTIAFGAGGHAMDDVSEKAP